MQQLVMVINMALEFEEIEQPIIIDEECEDAMEM